MTTASVNVENHISADSRHDLRMELVRLYVWEIPVRLCHWLIVLSILTLAVTGFYIGNPFGAVHGAAGQHFLMGTVKIVHYYAAIAFTLSVLTRIVWLFAGNRYAGWRQFIPIEPDRRKRFGPTLCFYLFFCPRPPLAVGHNPLAGATYTAVFLLYLTQIATGLGLYGMAAHVDSPLRFFAGILPLLGGAQTARWVHHVIMWLLLGFMMHHIASAILVSRSEKTGILESIFTGYKFFDPKELAERKEKMRP